MGIKAVPSGAGVCLLTGCCGQGTRIRRGLRRKKKEEERILRDKESEPRERERKREREIHIRTVLLVEKDFKLLLSVVIQRLVNAGHDVLVAELSAHETAAARLLHHLRAPPNRQLPALRFHQRTAPDTFVLALNFYRIGRHWNFLIARFYQILGFVVGNEFILNLFMLEFMSYLIK